MGRTLDLFKVLAPPLGNTAAEVRQWRWVMASFVYGLIVVFCFHLAATTGLLQRFGIDGVASATDLQDLSKDFKDDRRYRLERDIFNVRLSGCNATGPLRTSYANELSILMGQWQSLTGNNTGPDLLDCADLVAAP